MTGGKWALQAFTALFGTVCCLIALSHIAFGPAAIPGAIPVNAVLDSEDRFYATLFLGFGGALIWCSRALAERAAIFKALLLVFFCGGLARVISLISAGYPGEFFIALMGIELILPPFLWLVQRRLYPLQPGACPVHRSTIVADGSADDAA